MSSPSKSLYQHHSMQQQHHSSSSSSVPDNSYMMTSSHHVLGEKAFGHHHPSMQPGHPHYPHHPSQQGLSMSNGIRSPPPPPPNNSSSNNYHQHHPSSSQMLYTQQSWRPMAAAVHPPKNRFPPPPAPPPPPNPLNSSNGYRGHSNNNNYQMHNSVTALASSLPPNSSSSASSFNQSGLYAPATQPSSTYGQHNPSIQNQPPIVRTTNRRILTNPNAALPQSVIHRRLDMSPESTTQRMGNNTHHSSSSHNVTPTSRMPGPQSSNSAGTPNNKNTNRRRSSGTGQLAIKRSDQAPVTLKGWLYKQGSDGLMLWKKRWFVLSEFCLFYYKSSEEDKVSGSILLPSYKISPVVKEDGVVYHRKFSFKAEHHNMRTYFFAAETKESMIQWMNVLSLASILQQHQELKMSPPVLLPPSSNPQQPQRNYTLRPQGQQQQPPPPLIQSSTNYPPSNNNSVKVIQHHPPAVYQMFNSNGSAYVPAGLASQTPRYNQQHNPVSNGGSLDADGGPQPLYANAPPKPARRLNSSRDPDSDSENGGPSFNTQQPPVWTHNNNSNNNNNGGGGGGVSSNRLPHERRTPEAYARSQNHPMHRAVSGGDYDDPSLHHHPHRAPLPTYRQSQSRLHEGSSHFEPPFTPSRHRRRPHSADFLEHDRMIPGSTQDDQVITTSNRRRSGGNSSQPPRPKSSIDQPRMFRNEEEFHLWTEESYAQKMREQQVLLHQSMTTPTSRSQSRMSFARESNYNDSEAEVEKYFPTPMPRKPSYQESPTQSGGVPQYQNLPLSASEMDHHRSSEVRLEAITPNRLSEMGMMPHYEVESEASELMRSSSARLPRQRRGQPECDDPRRKDQDNTKLFFQREESMKRLLEWKQRMLQSPLTRKSSRNASRTQTPTNSSSPIPSSFPAFPTSSSSHDYIKQKVLEEFDKQNVGGIATNTRSLPSQQSSEKRLSRKGSSGSRSSRSRSSPRFGSRRDLSSSDENEPPMEVRSSRRRKSSSSGQIRSRASSRDSSKRSSSCHKRGSYPEIMAQVVEQQQIPQQPEYININSLEETLAKQRNGELSVIQRRLSEKKPHQYIGPDDWYKDDFDYDRFHSSFLQDPLLSRQYGELLSDRKRSEEGIDRPDLEVRLVKRPSLGSGKEDEEEEDSMKYPDSAYETMTFRANKEEETPFKNAFSLEDINEALDDESGSNSKPTDKRKRRSVKELLSDFEKKSKEVMLKESEALAEMENASRRRVCSDTETLLYDTSSSDDDEAAGPPPPLPNKSVPPIEQEYLPMLNKKASSSFGGSTPLPEDSHYVAMTPAAQLPHRNKSYPLLPRNDTPEEPSVLHSRTPSQTLVMEHLQKEMSGPMTHMVEEDTYVDMNEDGTVNRDAQRPPKRPVLASPLESPRYCEIDEGQVNRTKSSEVYYHEIPEETKSPLRPIEGLPDILGSNNSNNATNHSSSSQSLRRESLVSSSDQDSLRHRSSPAEESTRRSTSSSIFSESMERRHSRSSVFSNDSSGERSRSSQVLNASDTFKPASFFLDHQDNKTLPKKSHPQQQHQQYNPSHHHTSTSSLKDRELPKTPTDPGVPPHSSSEPHASNNNFPGFSFNLTYRSVYDTEGEATASTTEDDNEPLPVTPPSKVPYYVSDIVHEEEDIHPELGGVRSATLTSRSRRSKTPDNALQAEAPVNPHEDEGDVFLSSGGASSLKPARGVIPPPPPQGVPPLDVSSISSNPHYKQQQQQQPHDDYYWRENLRKASAQVISSPPPSDDSYHQHHHINGYLWDERSQRFYKLSSHPSSKTQEQLQSQTFLGEGLPATFSTNRCDQGRLPENQAARSNDALLSGVIPNTSSNQEEDQRAIHRRKSTGTNQKRDSLSAAVAKPKIQDNIWELSSQDLLSKSHEELVLMMIHLRRQSAALNEAIEASTAELENIQSNEESYFLVEDLRNHIRDLEEQMARGRPIVSLVDNMVKLGTLYRGPEGAPLSHRLRNIPSTPLQDEEISRESSTTKQRRAEIQELLQRSLEVVRQNINDEKELSKEDREALAEEQRVLETELSRVTNELESCQKKLDECSSDHARWEHDVLFLRQKLQASASRDMSIGLGQSAETLLVENELAQVQQRATELHKTRSAIQSKVESLTKRPSSSLLRSHQWVEEVLPPPPPPEDDEEEFNNTESSESFKKFLQSSGKGSAEAKTVRMVKRDAKERNLRAAEDDDHPEAISPPPPLPRGNYEHLHDFLKNEQEHQSVSSLSRTNSATTSRLASSNSDSKYLSSSTYKMLDMLRSHGKKEDRPGSSLSAHERLFGSSRDNSMSPPVSPQALGVKSGSSGGDSSLSSSFSANSPIFKSAAAKAIIQEVGGGSSSSSRRLKKRDKKRSYTITGSSSSAVMEALNDHAARARDDLDMERVLRGSSRPNAPDVVKSTLDKKDGKMNPSSIDNLFGVPDKIVIPERYVPEADIDNLSREERQVRLKKADSIRRMLTENTSTTDEPQNEEEKKQRERLLSLNQVLAREVMEKSRLVAGQSRSNRL